MKFDQYYSSSHSNLYIVTAANGRRLMIECGIRWPKLQKALGYDLSGIEACLLTHEHKDHSKAVTDVMRAGIDVYGSEETFFACGISGNRRSHVVIPKVLYSVDGFRIKAFASKHDAAGPLLYVIQCDECMLFATDTAYIRQSFSLPFSIIAIECSYDIKILQDRVNTKTINEKVAKRLLSSHMEKQVAMKYLTEFCDLSKCRQIHLLHMSGDNIDKKATKKEFEQRFFIETIMK